MDDVVAVLRRAGAEGRGSVRPGSSQLGSLGLHFNVDVQDVSAGNILAHLRAFMLLDPWLRAASFSSRSERLAALPDFSSDYTRKVLSPDYRPDLAGFTDDYLAANPSRDRALDLLPLLLHLTPGASGAFCRARRSPPARSSTTGCPKPMSATPDGASPPTGTAGSRSNGLPPTPNGWRS